jgi:hypothetical protein
MTVKATRLTRFLALLVIASAITACGGSGSTQVAGSATGVADASDQGTSAPTVRRGFLGAFFRPNGAVPFGVFSIYSKQIPPDPYPTPGRTLFGKTGYCDAPSATGQSITSGYLVDKTKLSDIVDLGVKWTRTEISPFFDDATHASGGYTFEDIDSAECALVRHHITPLIAIEAGPVQYNAADGTFAPKSVPLYKTAADFAQWCSVIAKHETTIFGSVYRYSIPGNEVNSNPQDFPGGDAQLARYTEACYHAIKSIEPRAFIYGFELNMDRNAAPAALVQRLYDIGCKQGTCYDGISMHLSLRYPIPPINTPCFPDSGGEYSLQCISDIQKAAHAPIHVIIGETGYFVPSTVRDEDTKVRAILDAMNAFAANPAVDGVNYANVDECDLYPTGYFSGGCIVDSVGTRLPGYAALKALAAKAY